MVKERVDSLKVVLRYGLLFFSCLSSSVSQTLTYIPNGLCSLYTTSRHGLVFFFLLLSKFGRLRIWSLPTSCNTFSIGVDLPMIKSKELF